MWEKIALFAAFILVILADKNLIATTIFKSVTSCPHKAVVCKLFVQVRLQTLQKIFLNVLLCSCYGGHVAVMFIDPGS